MERRQCGFDTEETDAEDTDSEGTDAEDPSEVPAP